MLDATATFSVEAAGQVFKQTPLGGNVNHYADLDGQFGVVVDVPSEVYELMRLFVYLAGCLDAE